MASARKLPSGRYRCLVYSHTDAANKRHYQSFTADTKWEAEQMAAQYGGSEKTDQSGMTFRDALDDYIRKKENVLSPATVREYKGMRNRYMQDLMDKKLSKITQTDIQKEINLQALTLSPKSVKNIHGLITTVMGTYRPDFAIHTDLPKKVPPNLYIPSEENLKKLMSVIQGTRIELPVLLAAFGPMRRGEIAALRVENIDGKIVHVCENMVQNEKKEWVIKSPKSYAGDRYIDYPVFVADMWKDVEEGRVCPLKPTQITKCFICALKKAGLPHFRFHDLRHYSASIQHALGIPDAYIMKRGGWSSDGVLKNVYRHAMDDQTIKMNQVANEHFEALFQGRR